MTFEIEEISKVIVNSDRSFGITFVDNVKFEEGYKKMEWDEFLEILELERLRVGKKLFPVKSLQNTKKLLDVLGYSLGDTEVYYSEKEPLVVTLGTYAILVGPYLEE